MQYNVQQYLLLNRRNNDHFIALSQSFLPLYGKLENDIFINSWLISYFKILDLKGYLQIAVVKIFGTFWIANIYVVLEYSLMSLMQLP